MRSIVRAGIVTGIVATSLAAAGFAYAEGSTKEVVFKNAAGSCNTGAATGTSTSSFAIINFPSNNTVAANIKLHKLNPDTTYTVRLVQTPNGASGSCGPVDTRLTTNRNGNGTVHWSEPRDAATTGAFVFLTGGTQGPLATDGVLDS